MYRVNCKFHLSLPFYVKYIQEKKNSSKDIVIITEG